VTLRVSRGDTVLIPANSRGSRSTRWRQVRRSGLRVGSRFGVSAQEITGQGVDLVEAGIEDGDVVGVQGRGAGLDAWVPAERRST
jgi:hypothetical protein